MTHFNCSGNSLTTLPALPNSMMQIWCSSNFLNSLPSLPNSLITLECSNNQLSSLPILPPYLSLLNCSNNNINCFNNFSLVINQLIINNNPFSCLPNYIPAMDSVTLTYPLCLFGNQNSCPSSYGIEGFIYKDTNSNCNRNIGDINLKNIPVQLFDSTNTLLNQTYSAINGVYQFPQNMNTYTIKIDTTNKPFIANCIYPGLDSTITSNILDTNINFALTCKTGFDLGVQSVLTTGWVFPGQVHHLKINAGDMAKWFGLNCAAGISGQMVVNVLGAVHYSTSAVGALVPMVSGNTFTFTISDFGTISNLTDFDLVFQTDTTANVGDSICVSITMTPTLGDINLSNNTYHYCYQVINSHDPNKKEVYPIDVLPNYQDWFTYTIHFQNTGSAPAMNIRFKDTLDANLNLETFEVINYSHQNTWQLYKNLLVFNFQNIQLPDSTSNPEGSKGFVQYRIKPKANRPFGSQIKNTAYIYFDYNAPIITNTTINHFTTPASINENFINKTVSIYPNPTTGIFSIQLNSTEKHNLEVLDMTGKLVIQHIIEDGHALIDGDSLSNGIYSIKVSNNSGSITKKLVIVK